MSSLLGCLIPASGGPPPTKARNNRLIVDTRPAAVRLRAGYRTHRFQTRLLPLPELGLGVPVGVGAVLEDHGDRVQTTEIRRVAVVVLGSTIAHCSSVQELTHSCSLEGRLLAPLARRQALRLAVEAAVRPDARPVGDRASGLDPQELTGALKADLHLRTAVDREHSAGHDFSRFFTDLFA